MNTINEIKNTLDEIHSRLEEVEEQINGLEGRVLESNEAEQMREKTYENWEYTDTMNSVTPSSIMGIITAL